MISNAEANLALGGIHFLCRRPRGEGGLAKFLLY